MQQARLIMGMPISITLVDQHATNHDIDAVFDYFTDIDERFSPYIPTSEVARINHGLAETDWSSDMATIMRLAEQTRKETGGYFDVYSHETFDPSGIVKGWAINNAAELLRERGCQNFCIDAGGDVQVAGHNEDSEPWRVGIRNPFNRDEVIKIVGVSTEGVATSGTYIRGDHIYNPLTNQPAHEIASLTVIGPNVYEADRFATAAFAMGKQGVNFIESLAGFEAYMIDNDKQATLTSGFERFVL
jgi:thiamine biosynthesis lipoprotein